ncbi:Metallo-dependent phosphatase-like protein [Phascolomyces articulosus]|uniref:Metallo-dependent phosphatase-like protein n=1 Tax=Phascolomyces articulosus TaxID=60185 RepID=A0AAD5JME3_9FUNG|nr:Metallo-dependent phosphatase-like protein [Phascolomyces articulosus]
MYFVKTVVTTILLSSTLTYAYLPIEQQHPLQKPSRNVPNLNGKFLHITDIHIDPYYQDEATIKSGCHFQAKKHHKKKKRKGKLAGYWGSPTKGCDAPPRLAEHAIDWIGERWKEEIDFIVWTGDNARHDLDSKNLPRTKKEILALNQAITYRIQEAFHRKDNTTIPIIPCIGNNDVHPHNRLQVTSMIETYSEMWRDFIPPDQLPVFRQGGYYAIDIAPGLRVLVLNTLYFFNSNDLVNGCQDRDGPEHAHFEWIIDQLAMARRDRARVYITGHVPPTDRTFYPACLDRYIDISLEYQDVITGHFYGHVNRDHFNVLQKNQDRAKDKVDITKTTRDEFSSMLRKQYKRIQRDKSAVVVHVAPPIIPEYNPTFRINEYDTDPTSSNFGTWTKYTQYYIDLNYYNGKKHPELESPQFYEEYATDTEYGMKDLSTESWMDLAQRLTQKGSKKSKKLWKKFVNNLFVQTEH